MATKLAKTYYLWFMSHAVNAPAKEITDIPTTVDLSLRVHREHPFYCALENVRSKQITEADLRAAVRRFGAMANRLTAEEWQVLEALHKTNQQGAKPPEVNDAMKSLLANSVVFEYNDGSYRQLSPIIAAHPTYQQNAATWSS